MIQSISLSILVKSKLYNLVLYLSQMLLRCM